MLNEPKIKQRYRDFAIAYVGKCQGNAVAAAKAAGYTDAYAIKKSYLILAQPDVQEYIQWLNSQTIGDDIATIENLKQFWTGVMLDGGNELKERLRASELLARSLGAFNNDW